MYIKLNVHKIKHVSENVTDYFVDEETYSSERDYKIYEFKKKVHLAARCH